MYCYIRGFEPASIELISHSYKLPKQNPFTWKEYFNELFGKHFLIWRQFVFLIIVDVTTLDEDIPKNIIIYNVDIDSLKRTAWTSFCSTYVLIKILFLVIYRFRVLATISSYVKWRYVTKCGHALLNRETNSQMQVSE